MPPPACPKKCPQCGQRLKIVRKIIAASSSKSAAIISQKRRSQQPNRISRTPRISEIQPMIFTYFNGIFSFSYPLLNLSLLYKREFILMRIYAFFIKVKNSYTPPLELRFVISESRNPHERYTLMALWLNDATCMMSLSNL